MPKVHTRTRKRAEVKKEMRCAAFPCKVMAERLNGSGDATYEQQEAAREIKVGDTYYTWSRKMGRSGVTYFQHKECGYPKRSQLSSRKTVAIEDAIDDANDRIVAWVPELDPDGTHSGGYEDVTDALQSVAETANDVGQEYQDGFDNMPEGLNQGDTAQAMEAVAQELDSWADDLESWSPSSDEPDMPDKDDYKQAGLEDGEDDYDLDAWRDACETALDDWASEIRSEAEDAMSDMPEYQG